MIEEHDILVKLRDATKFINRSYPSLLKDIKEHKIQAVRFGGQWRIRKSELERFMTEGNLDNAHSK